MGELQTMEAELREGILQFLLPLQTTRELNRAAFQKVEQSASRLASTLKGVDLVSKGLLKQLYSTFRVMRAEAPYIRGHEKELVEMSDRLQLLFDLIIWNEAPEDRKPGVPRIR